MCVILICVFALVGFIYWVDYKKKKDGVKEKSTDPIFKTIFATFVVIGIAIIMELVGVVPKGWVKENFWWFIIFAIIIFAIYMWVATRSRLMSYRDLRIKAWNHLIKEFGALTYIGEAYNIEIPKFMERQVGVISETIKEITSTFEFHVVVQTVAKKIWITLNSENGRVLTCIVGPDLDIIKDVESQAYGLKKEPGVKSEFEGESHTYKGEQTA